MVVTCPPGVGPGMSVRIMVAKPPPLAAEKPTAPFGQTKFDVVVPQGVFPGQPFCLIANGHRVMLTCPQRTMPGQKVCPPTHPPFFFFNEGKIT